MSPKADSSASVSQDGSLTIMKAVGQLGKRSPNTNELSRNFSRP